MQMRQRLQGALNKVKASNFVAPGRTRPAWLVYSRTPAERRRSALAGKTKRLILQITGDGGDQAQPRGRMGFGDRVAGRHASSQCGIGVPSARTGGGHRGMD
jgi:hypothetical protein